MAAMTLKEILGKVTASQIALIITNLIPLIGVFFLGWDIFTILFLYWSETAIILFFSMLKIALAQEDIIVISAYFRSGSNRKRKRLWIILLVKLFMISIFLWGYIFYMGSHLAIIYGLFGPRPQTSTPDQLISILIAVLIGWANLFISHAISFYTNYLQTKEYETASIIKLMIAPFKRITLMQLTVMCAAVIMYYLEWPAWVLVAMVLLKIGMDLIAHRKEHALQKIIDLRQWLGKANSPDPQK